MAYLVRWWLTAELVGLFTLPLTFRMFRGLPDRGYAFARLFGLLLIAYVAWLGGTAGLLPYSTGSVVVVLLTLGAAGGALFIRNRDDIVAWLRASRGYAVAIETTFLVVMLVVAFLRSYQPAIAGTEKPFEFANLNAVHRTQDFAQTDPWLAGKPDAYYYFGYVVVDGVAKVTGTPTNYAFNLGLILVAGLSAVAAFGLAANVARLLRGTGKIADEWPLIAGALAVVLLLVIGNLEGILEFGAAHGLNPSWVYTRMDIQGLQPRPSSHWWPDESFFGSAWRATRLGSNWNFLEFPSFSFLLGDLHPHVLALPFMLLAAGFGLGIACATDLLTLDRWPGAWPLVAGALLSLSAFVGLHPWDFPPLAVLIGGLFVWRVWRPGTESWPKAAVLFIGFVVVAFIPFAPFLLTQSRTSTHGISPTEVYFRDPTVAEPSGMYLPFQHFLLFWLPLMLPALIFVLWCLGRRRWRPIGAYGSPMLSLVLLLPLAWAFAVLFRHGGGGLRSEWGIRGWGWLTVLVLGLILTASLCAIWAEVRDNEREDGREARLFLLASIAIAVLLVYGPELFFVKDSSGTRANSTFKLWYCSWALLSVAGATGGVWALWQWRPTNPFSLLARPLTAGLAAAVVLGALVYTLDASFSRTSGFNFSAANGYRGSPTLDGLAYLRQNDPDELGAAIWLNQHVPDVQTVLEWVGGSYSDGGRVASRTGLPSVLDWPFHELQQRGSSINAELNQRAGDVQTIYQTQDINQAFQLLTRYGVKYVVVGGPERFNYFNQSADGLSKFAQMGTAVYQSQSVTIYRIGAAPLFAAGR